MFKKVLIGAALLAVAAIAQAQTPTAGVIEITPNIQSANGEVTPTLTWKTTPAAKSCTASGDWSGTKADSGTETLPKTMKSVTFNLSCDWGKDDAKLNWAPPTTNTDGSAYTDPKGYRIAYGTAENQLTQVVDINDVATTTFTVKPLAPGKWYFGIVAVNQRDVTSDMSAIVSTTLGTVTGTGSVGITVNPKPSVVTNVSVE